MNFPKAIDSETLIEIPQFQSDQTRKSSFSSNKTLIYWDTIEQKATEFLDNAHVFKGDPLMKQEKFFEKNKLQVLNSRKYSTHSTEKNFSFKLTFKKWISCVEFEKVIRIEVFEEKLRENGKSEEG